ncbi:MAG: hypothetical protein HS111_19805 [Kofleriaceae bacterium]|nr:hypothetical protein [Kofleriaceae bacterium]MCL4225184.1 hypothetical protein [Myxococcales bacterium]
MRSLTVLTFIAAAACGEVEPGFIDAPPGGDGDGGVDAAIDGGGDTCDPACGENAACAGTTCLCNNGFVGDGYTCRAIWARIATTQLRLANVVAGQTNGVIAAGLRNRIYFGPEIGSESDPAHYMRHFNVDTMAFSAPLALPPSGQRDFCACGDTEVFVGATDSSGNEAVYMFGNYGFRYQPDTGAGPGSWTPVSSYVGSFRRGEAAGAFEANNRFVYMIGGRGPLDTAIRFSVAGQSFDPEPGILPYQVDSARAWAPAGNNLVYVAGGFASDNSRRHLIRTATGTNQWTTLADAPADLGSTIGMGDFGGRIWVATRNGLLYFYDPGPGTWRTSPITAPAGAVAVVTTSGRTFALIQNGDILEVHELMAIE